MWFMFGATQLLVGSKVSPELEMLGMILNANGGSTFKIALFTSSASLGASTEDYSTSNEKSLDRKSVV